MEEIYCCIEKLCDYNKNLKNINITKLSVQGLILLLLSNNIIVEGQYRIILIESILNNNPDIIFSNWWHESPFMLIAICGLNKYLLNDQELYELLELFVNNSTNLNLNIDTHMLHQQDNNPLFIGMPLDIIVLNPNISMEYKKKIIKLFTNKNYSLYPSTGQYGSYIGENTNSNIQRNINNPSLLTKILCYNDTCNCNYDSENNELCKKCLNGGSYNKNERIELANFLIDECNFEINKKSSNQTHGICISIIYELLIFSNIDRLYDGILFLINRNIHFTMLLNIIPFNDMIQIELQKYTTNNDQIDKYPNKYPNTSINTLKNIYILCFDYVNNTEIQLDDPLIVELGRTTVLNFYTNTISIDSIKKVAYNFYSDIISIRNKRILGITKYNGITPIYSTKYIREIFILMCIIKYDHSINKGLKQMMKYKIIGELFF